MAKTTAWWWPRWPQLPSDKIQTRDRSRCASVIWAYWCTTHWPGDSIETIGRHCRDMNRSTSRAALCAWCSHSLRSWAHFTSTCGGHPNAICWWSSLLPSSCRENRFRCASNIKHYLGRQPSDVFQCKTLNLVSDPGFCNLDQE